MKGVDVMSNNTSIEKRIQEAEHLVSQCQKEIEYHQKQIDIYETCITNANKKIELLKKYDNVN